jgi:plasmid maintenance system antidote protein VapI
MAVDEVPSIEFDSRKLEAALAESKISQAELARMVGFAHRNVVTKIIKGRRGLSANDLLRISAALERAPEDFAKA